MVIAFFDASAIVKRYSVEPDRALVFTHDAVIVAQLSEVEVASAIWRKRRGNQLTAVEASTLTRAVQRDFHDDSPDAPFAVVALSDQLVGRSVDAIAQHGLRTGDAIQLASALVARESLPDCEAFAAFDVRLRNAAQAVGFVLIPREEQLA